MRNLTDDLTPEQRRLYDAVRTDRSGRDLAVVLAEQDATDADRAAVAQALDGR